MDILFELLPVLLITLITASMGGKKKKGKKKRKEPRAARRAQSTMPDVFEEMRAQQNAKQLDMDDLLNTEEEPDDGHDRDAAFAKAFGETALTRETECKERPLHLHTVTQRQMHAAGEGEDPCHAGGTQYAEETVDNSLDAEAERQDALREDVLRGVIMSEILTRPCERRAQRNGR